MRHTLDPLTVVAFGDSVLQIACSSRPRHRLAAYSLCAVLDTALQVISGDERHIAAVEVHVATSDKRLAVSSIGAAVFCGLVAVNMSATRGLSKRSRSFGRLALDSGNDSGSIEFVRCELIC
jgi:hypothetical protein